MTTSLRPPTSTAGVPWWRIFWALVALMAVFSIWILAQALMAGCDPYNVDLIHKNYWP